MRSRSHASACRATCSCSARTRSSHNRSCAACCTGAAHIAFDSRSRAGSERVEVSTTDGRLIRIGGDPSSPSAHGEHLGLLHLTEDVARATFDVAAELLQRGGERLSLVTALNVVARRHPIACVDIADLRWVEIDYPKDLPAARTEVWPAVAELRSRPPARARTGRAPEKRAAAFPSHA